MLYRVKRAVLFPVESPLRGWFFVSAVVNKNMVSLNRQSMKSCRFMVATLLATSTGTSKNLTAENESYVPNIRQLWSVF